ncbi:ATP-dependent RecD-like DNA helicase [compost metagenome]
MDESRYLVLLNGEDKTSKIESYEINGTKLRIQFHRSSKEYEYNLDKVVIKDNPIVISIENKVVYHEDIPLFGVEHLLNFDGIIRVFFKNRKSSIYTANKIRIVDNSISTHNAQCILAYWRQISNFLGKDEGAGEVLNKIFQKLTFVSQESVLGSYINKEPVKNISSSTNNIIFPFNFNLSQKDALDHALKSNLSVIEGPPGTGKTQTILNIISNIAIMQGKSVAVVSSNNAAVKNVKDKLEERNYQFFVASLGSKDNQKIFFDNLPQYESFFDDQYVLNEKELMEKIQKLNHEIEFLMNLNNEKARVQQELAAYKIEKQHFDHYYETQNYHEMKQSFFRTTPEKIISFLADYTFATNNNKEDGLLYKAKLLIKYGFTNYKALKKHQMDMIIDLQQRYYLLKIESLEKTKDNLKQKLDHADYDQLLEKYQEYSSLLLKYTLHKKYHGWQQVELNERTYKKNFKTFINQFPVILSTTHSLRNCIPENYLFDYVIIDEASQVDLLSGVLALSCCKNVIIVGDTKQLPQIVNITIESKINLEYVDESYNYFRHNILSSILSLYKDELPKTLLKEHYRCHPKIIEFCNQKYYKGELVPFREEKEGDEPLILYRTSEGNHMRELKHSKGKFNQRELMLSCMKFFKILILRMNQ